MENTDLLQSGDATTYRVHDLIADIFDVEVNDAQAEKILTLYPRWKGKTGVTAVMGLADDICRYFVGRGIPWSKETRTDEQTFWYRIKSERENFLYQISN